MKNFTELGSMPMPSYFHRGAVNRYPLVFLHGFLGCKEDWLPVIAPLEEHFSCYALDLPGHGASPFRPDVFQAILDTLDALNLSKACLVGYSLGGRLALSLKEQFPDRFSQLIVLSGHTGLRTATEKQIRWQQDLDWIQKFETLPLNTCLDLWYQQPLFSTLNIDPILRERRLHQNKEALIFYLHTFSLAHQPVRTDQDALFLCGRYDERYVSHYQMLCAEKAISTVRIIEGAGHAIHLEKPLACAQAIRFHVTLENN
jgi:2-succinyl-6-hydroxy-2,4-cyclohexadiene-1-carboxylate synthase